jgi:hypothetical protein
MMSGTCLASEAWLEGLGSPKRSVSSVSDCRCALASLKAWLVGLGSLVRAVSTEGCSSHGPDILVR